MPALSEQVATLLQQSHAAHRAYRAAKPRPQAPGSSQVIQGDPDAALVALRSALKTREDADVLDSGHTAQAWKGEPLHNDLLAFYREQLAKETIP